jgi:hypothetical protein
MDGRVEISRRKESGGGDLELLLDGFGAERLPDLRGSLGESGGPITAAWAIRKMRERKRVLW